LRKVAATESVITTVLSMRFSVAEELLERPLDFGRRNDSPGEVNSGSCHRRRRQYVKRIQRERIIEEMSSTSFEKKKGTGTGTPRDQRR
jgi:hypothetical protein